VRGKVGEVPVKRLAGSKSRQPNRFVNIITSASLMRLPAPL
jgi:hypothetical protein